MRKFEHKQKVCPPSWDTMKFAVKGQTDPWLHVMRHMVN